MDISLSEWFDGSPQEQQRLEWTAAVLVVMGIMSFVSLTVGGQNAPYGRYSTTGWGWLVPGKLAWIVQESPVLIAVVMCWWNRDERVASQLPNLVLLTMLSAHYFNR
jgi:3-oxo-5-alpha-steroid 4-dehydrogenase 1